MTIGRLAWADRDAPAGRVSIWRDGAWLPPRQVIDLADAETWGDPTARRSASCQTVARWSGDRRCVLGTVRALEPVSGAVRDAAEPGWDESFNNEGIYVSYAQTLSDPRAWSAPQKIMNGGGWYPQVAGLEPAIGSDKDADRRARFFLTGRSERFIEFQK